MKVCVFTMTSFNCISIRKIEIHSCKSYMKNFVFIFDTYQIEGASGIGSMHDARCRYQSRPEMHLSTDSV